MLIEVVERSGCRSITAWFRMQIEKAYKEVRAATVEHLPLAEETMLADELEDRGIHLAEAKELLERPRRSCVASVCSPNVTCSSRWSTWRPRRKPRWPLGGCSLIAGSTARS